MSDWTEQLVRIEKAKEANKELREGINNAYKSTRAAGLDHEETYALFLGVLRPLVPQFWPLISLWIRRKKDGPIHS